jgi:hypothetical protein
MLRDLRLLGRIQMSARRFGARASALLLALAIASCSTTNDHPSLTTGMTADETVQAMGPPDLKDSVPDPDHSGATVPRYVWLDSGKVAVFGSNNRVASIQQIEAPEKAQTEVQARNQPPPSTFDPLETPLNYAFFPIKAALIYIGAGLNCVAGSCEKPKLPDPSHG